jgi:molecular chaperone HscB
VPAAETSANYGPTMVECPSCARRFEPCLVCPECGSPVTAELDCFATLGLPRRLTIDLSQLETAYHDMGRRLHPDRFAASPSLVRDASLRSTALLTRSYRTLRDPVSRGLYWLELNREKLAENNQAVPPEIAELVFEVQEQIAELRDPAGRRAAGAAIEARRVELLALMKQATDELTENFMRWDQFGSDPGRRPVLIIELKKLLSRIAYLRTLIRDVDRGLENAKAA